MENVVRFVPPIGEPLGLDFRPGPQDHTVLLQLMSENRATFNSVVVDPAAAQGAHKELVEEANRRLLETVLDPRFMELETAMGFTESRAAKLAWAGRERHTFKNLSGEAGKEKIAHLADFVMKHRFSSVISPTHFIADSGDRLFAVDQQLTADLREALNSRGGNDITIQYALAIHGRVFADAEQRSTMKRCLRQLPIDAVRLRVHPFGHNSGHVSLLRYIQSCRDLHDLDVPVIAERTGNVGLALLAFAAVSGLETGITTGDKFDIGLLKRPREQAAGFAIPRVYLPDLGLFLPKQTASEMFNHPRLRHAIVCRDTACCPSSGSDMLSRSRRHFVFTRMGEVALLNKPPAQFRPNEYLEKMLRPATDRMTRILQIKFEDERLRAKLEAEQNKQAGWRQTLGQLATQPVSSVPRTPTRRQRRDGRDAQGGR